MTTASYLAFHAAERPDAIALIAQGRQVSFAEFHRDLGKVTRALHALGRPPGSSVAVRCADVYWHWLLLLGFERLAVTTASLDEREGEAAAPFLATVDFLLSDGPPMAAAKGFHSITSDWCQQVLSGEPVADAGIYESIVEAPMRIVRTSGTTGVAKRLHFSHAVRDAWLSATNWYVPQDTRSRFLMTLPLTVEAANAALTCCLRGGGTVVAVSFNQTGAIPAMIHHHGISHIGLVPAQLRQLIDELPVDFRKPANLTIVTFGGAVGDALRAEALTRLTDRLFDIYGTNEAGLISLRRMSGPDGVGLVVPTAKVQVVDDADAPLPEGQIGWLRLRGAGMFQGYIDDPEANRRMLRDGWFYPGDVGVLLGNRRLKILGRGDELLNIGGVKVGPDRIEDQVRMMVPVQDVGVCGIRNRDKVDEVYLGVVKAAGDGDEIYNLVLAAVGQLGLGRFYLVKLDRIPRNANGKIRRKQLKRAIADEILRHDPDWTERVMLDPAEIDPAADDT